MPAGTVGLKWPNDVLLAGRKVSGILIESGTVKGEDGLWLAIGIGVNLAHAPDGLERGQTCVVRLDRETFDGVAEGLDPDGALRLRTAGGELRRIHAGDVFFGEG